MMTDIIGRADLDELALGGLIVATAVKGK
jgi:hypothetical protein